MKAPRRRWSEDELKHALDLRVTGHSYREIDRALGRWPGATQQRLQIAGWALIGAVVVSGVVYCYRAFR
jgi:hypothetical protein